MTTRLPESDRRGREGFTLLEVIIVLFIMGLVLTAIHTIAQGTMTLANDTRRAQHQQNRQQAFTAFCERLFTSLPPTAALNLKTSQEGGQYMTVLELFDVPSPFNSTPEQVVMLYTEPLVGGGMRLMLSSQPKPEPGQTESTGPAVRVTLFDELPTCEWRAYDPSTRQWTNTWAESIQPGAQHRHPTLLELVVKHFSHEERRVFWVAPSEPVNAGAIMPPNGQQQGTPNPNSPQVPLPNGAQPPVNTQIPNLNPPQ